VVRERTVARWTPDLFEDLRAYTGDLYASAPNCGREAPEGKKQSRRRTLSLRAGRNTRGREGARCSSIAATIVCDAERRDRRILAPRDRKHHPFHLPNRTSFATALEQAANWVFFPRAEVLASNLRRPHFASGLVAPLGVRSQVQKNPVWKAPTSFLASALNSSRPPGALWSSSRELSPDLAGLMIDRDREGWVSLPE